MVSTLIVVGGALALAGLVLAFIVTRLIYICAPNEVLIFSGARRQVEDRDVGYRLIQGGRGIRIPLFEKVDRMDLTNMILEVKVQGAYAKGGIPLNVEAMANLKIAGSEPVINNAIERFLGKPREMVMKVARETLEGNLRGILATLTPEEVNRDRVKFAQELLHEADKDLSNLGLELDTLKIQHVSDDKSYLDSLGRRQSAELLMRARIAEAENWALSAERSAHNFENQEIARIDAEIAGGLRAIPVVERENFVDVVALEFVLGLGEREDLRQHVAGQAEVVGSDHARLAEHDRLLDAVLELADVARPVVLANRDGGVRREAFDLRVVLARVA